MKLIYLLLFVLFCGYASAQQEGVIVFEEKMDLHKRLPPEREQYKDMIPQFRSVNFELHYTAEETMYVVSKEQAEPEGEHQGRRMRFRGMGAQNRQVYKNIPDNQMVDSRDFMDKKFLIKGALDELQWKVTGNQAQILNYICMEATWQDTANSYVAWFTPQIPVASGPAEFAGLPGMIMRLDINDGERLISAKSVTEQEVDPEMVKEPKKGKEVTSEEYRAIVREKMEEMRAEGGGPGMHMRVIRQ